MLHSSSSFTYMPSQCLSKNSSDIAQIYELPLCYAASPRYAYRIIESQSHPSLALCANRTCCGALRRSPRLPLRVAAQPEARVHGDGLPTTLGTEAHWLQQEDVAMTQLRCESPVPTVIPQISARPHAHTSPHSHTVVPTPDSISSYILYIKMIYSDL